MRITSTEAASALSGTGTSASRKLPGLDGLRAVAVVLVLCGHYAARPDRFQVGLADTVAALGVDIFFVISGMLITHLLVAEEERFGAISLRLFWARRALRILPPLFLFLSVLALMMAAGVLRIPAIDFVAGVLFARNYIGSAVETAHLWSLAIEEQFYLLWPLVVTFAPGGKTRLWYTSALVLLVPAWRQAAYWIAGGATFVDPQRTDLRVQPLLFGCLLAVALGDPAIRTVLRNRRLQSGQLIAALIGFIVVGTFSPLATWPIVRVAAPSITYAAVALLVNAAIHRAGGIMGTLLNLEPVAWLGRLSYSLYLWQQVFAPSLLGGTGAWFREYPINVGLTLGCAGASYYLVERPLFALRHRLQQTVTPLAGSSKPSSFAAVPPIHHAGV